jgi:hypothetical protein
MFTIVKRFPIPVLLATLLTTSACAGDDSEEAGDSGPLPATATATTTSGNPGEEEEDSGPPPVSTSEQMCEKYDYCNALGVGFSVDDCLDKQDCGNFFECMYDQGECSLLTCHSDCDWCHLGTEYEGACPAEWQGDGECDCGCQWADVDC